MDSSEANGRRRASVTLLITAGTALSGLGGIWPSPFNYIAVLGGAVLFGLATHGVLTWPTWSMTSWRQWLRRGILATGVGVTLALVLWLGVPWVYGKITVWRFGCPQATVISVLTTPDNAGSALEIAERFEIDTLADECPTARIDVYARPDADAIKALSVAWPDDQLSRVGARPDVWLPESSLQVRRLRDAATVAGKTLPLQDTGPWAYSPVVVALSPADATRLDAASGGEEQRDGRSTVDILSVLDATGIDLLRADPKGSATGALATFALQSGMAGPDGQPPSLTRLRTVEHRIAGALTRRGYPLGSSTELLCRYRGDAAAGVAVMVAERDLYRLNGGLSLGNECASMAEPLADGLLAYYPVDAPALDLPFVDLRWAGRSDGQSTTVQRFEEWLRDDAGRQAIADAGLRPAEGDALAPLAGSDGVLQSAAFLHRTPEVAAVDAVLRRYDDVRRPARILLALDASGSMGTRDNGPSRFAIAANGVQSALPLMGDDDEFGVWVFPDGSGQGGRRELVPVGRRDDPVNGVARSAAVAAGLGGVQPGGRTPLYSTVIAGADLMASGPPEYLNAVVVLTDGDDDNASGSSASAMVTLVRDRGVRVFAIAIGEAQCTATALKEVTAATGGRCYDGDVATLDRNFQDLFATLWGGTAGGR